ncbi:YggU family protein [Candidatus Woesearchaeota archaeon]|nr:YggU family protein [Candidatus Woesearchaeota archaeon]MBT4321782.1 YggU family protein [Candidatus Woesearchaeota archaeon]MBT4631142.1 YggU family protein [Candidatus Woesearchaeota archaeon]
MRVKIIVKANSNENKVLGFDENYQAYRVKIKAKPKDGEANKEIEKFLSKTFKKKVKIVSGFKSNKKVIDLL